MSDTCKKPGGLFINLVCAHPGCTGAEDGERTFWACNFDALDETYGGLIDAMRGAGWDLTLDDKCQVVEPRCPACVKEDEALALVDEAIREGVAPRVTLPIVDESGLGITGTATARDNGDGTVTVERVDLHTPFTGGEVSSIGVALAEEEGA